ncbi:hypothetical protein CI109_101025 [Kwoniella shandongensis]|uniref:CP-type G domain-containing protein n=1 Tax=Kwoniella shandongensis TaxID=1734106 RepID=A0AAJ8LF40_9TREE
MPKAKKAGGAHKSKVYALPTTQKKRENGIPKIQALVGKQKAKLAPTQARPTASSLAALSANSEQPLASGSGTDYGNVTFHEPIDSSLTRDSSSKAFMRELRKVIERSDVIIQVLDARDPEGTRSRWVEEEVRKRDAQGKKLLAVLNKIDLVPRANLEAWLKYLRHNFPTMPFKSSTQNQRQNLSQNAVPLAQPSAVPGQQVNLPALPTTSSSLGAPALLHLLKQYALSTPHSALTVGVVGYPNVGKSSLINSLKRSRACAVAAMPGKTRIVQEVVLDKGVKILDCPGVVLEDVGRQMESEEGKRKQAEIMLRNCVKAELVDDPITPVEVILRKVDPVQLQKLYNIPAYDDVRDFLIKMALTRGRLGKGGIPDLEGSAVSVLRDWNSGKIAYFTIPPKVHASSAPAPVSAAAPVTDSGIEEDVEMAGEKVGDAKILTTLSEAFTLDGLFDTIGDDAAWAGEEMAEQDAIVEEDTEIAPSVTSSAALRLPPTAQPNKLFTPEELAVLPSGILDRQKMRQQAKKAKKRQAAVARTEGELMLGFMDMGMEEPEAEVEEIPSQPLAKRSKKEKRKEKKTKNGGVGLSRQEREREMEVEMDEEEKKEKDFASFLATIGADDSDEEL